MYVCMQISLVHIRMDLFSFISCLDFLFKYVTCHGRTCQNILFHFKSKHFVVSYTCMNTVVPLF